MADGVAPPIVGQATNTLPCTAGVAQGARLSRAASAAVVNDPFFRDRLVCMLMFSRVCPKSAESSQTSKLLEFGPTSVEVVNFLEVGQTWPWFGTILGQDIEQKRC